MQLPLVVVLVLPIIAAAEDFTGKVVRIVDGDTLVVLAAGNRQVRIRLDGIDAPESGQAFGTRAKQAAADLAAGKDVTIRPRGTDRYGRTLARVTLPDGRDLGRELVRAGLAWWYRQYAPRDADLARIEAEARRDGRGLWSQPGAVAPWGWRKAKAKPRPKPQGAPGMAGATSR